MRVRLIVRPISLNSVPCDGLVTASTRLRLYGNPRFCPDEYGAPRLVFGRKRSLWETARRDRETSGEGKQRSRLVRDARDGHGNAVDRLRGRARSADALSERRGVRSLSAAVMG